MLKKSIFMITLCATVSVFCMMEEIQGIEDFNQFEGKVVFYTSDTPLPSLGNRGFGIIGKQINIGSCIERYVIRVLNESSMAGDIFLDNLQIKAKNLRIRCTTREERVSIKQNIDNGILKLDCPQKVLLLNND